jgi:hypothetical protein
VEPYHHLRVTSNNRMCPVVKTSVDPRRYEKLAPLLGFEPTAPRGRAGGLARARTAWLYLDGTCMPESARWEAFFIFHLHQSRLNRKCASDRREAALPSEIPAGGARMPSM